MTDMNRKTVIGIMYDVRKYFHEHLQQYDLNTVEIYPVSNHPDDWYLYRVMAKKPDSDEWAAWTCWNQITQSLNYGHYNLTYKQAKEIFENGI